MLKWQQFQCSIKPTFLSPPGHAANLEDSFLVTALRNKIQNLPFTE